MTILPQNQPEKPQSWHILPALTVLVILISMAIYADSLAVPIENAYAISLAREFFPQREYGSVIQQAVFRQPGLLPVFGSSEITATNTPNRALFFFDQHPTGFMVFDVARGGNNSLLIAQDLASLGPVIRGKKIVISFTPWLFSNQQKAGKDNNSYNGNFSLIHANGLVFSTDISMAVKRQTAKRMTEYPDTFEQNPVLRLALYQLIMDTPYNDFFYYTIMPLGQLNNSILRLQDHYASWRAIEDGQIKVKQNKKPAGQINWNSEIAKAEAQQKLDTNSNRYGINNEIWEKARNSGGFALREPGTQDQTFLTNLASIKEWEDFNILLEVMQELDVRPLILSRPINGVVYSAAGISPQVQTTYYEKLQKTVEPYKFPIVDFRDHTNDLYFSTDFLGHSSPKGWLYVDQTLDAFYHDRLAK